MHRQNPKQTDATKAIYKPIQQLLAGQEGGAPSSYPRGFCSFNMLRLCFNAIVLVGRKLSLKLGQTLSLRCLRQSKNCRTESRGRKCFAGRKVSGCFETQVRQLELRKIVFARPIMCLFYSLFLCWFCGGSGRAAGRAACICVTVYTRVYAVFLNNPRSSRNSPFSRLLGGFFVFHRLLAWHIPTAACGCGFLNFREVLSTCVSSVFSIVGSTYFSFFLRFAMPFWI